MDPWWDTSAMLERSAPAGPLSLNFGVLVEPISTALQTRGAEAALEAAKPLIQRLFGPGFDELGGIAGDWFRRRRLQLMLRSLSSCEEMIRAAGIEPKRVPLKVLSPILEGMSLEDNESLSHRWAALLANAAKEPTSVRPGFTQILSDLSHTDAVLLDFFAKTFPRTHTSAWGIDYEEWSASYYQLRQELQITEDEIQLSVSNLQRLGLIEQDSPMVRTVGSPLGQMGSVQSSLRASAIGREFYRACQAPMTE